MYHVSRPISVLLVRARLGEQTKICHTLALAAAEAETGMSRPNIDRAFIPVLLELMSDPGSRRGPDIPLLACRALNYFLQVRLMRSSPV